MSLSAYSQSLSLKIDSIVVDDQDPAERVFKLVYHLENMTDEELLFLQDTTGIVPSTGGSGTYFPYYKIYEEDVFLEIGSFFSGWRRKEINLDNLNLDSLMVVYKERLQTDRKEKRILEKIIKIAPREIKSFSMDFYWDRNRYYQNHDMEYYLEEKSQHFIEITMVMQKPNLESESFEEALEKIANDKNFIQGVFTSNKMAINFRE